MFNWIVWDALQYLESFNPVQTNEFCCIELESKVGDFSQGWPESSIFNSYYTEM